MRRYDPATNTIDTLVGREYKSQDSFVAQGGAYEVDMKPSGIFLDKNSNMYITGAGAGGGALRVVWHWLCG